MLPHASVDKSDFASRVYSGKRFYAYQAFDSKERARHMAKRLRETDPGFYKGKLFRIVEYPRWRYYGFAADENRNKPTKKIYVLYIGPRRT